MIPKIVSSVHFSSVAQSCPTFCNPMDCSIPGFPIHHQLQELVQMQVHWVSDAVQPSHPLSSPSPPAFNLSQHQGHFKSQFFTSGGQSTGVSALASFLPKQSQGWSPSEWIGWLSLQSKGLSGVFSNKSSKASIFRRSAFFTVQLSLDLSNNSLYNDEHFIA